MTKFQGSLHLVGDASPAVIGEVAVSDGSVAVRTGAHELGNWPFGELDIARRTDGFHIGAEGEELVFKADDPIGFATAVGLMGNTNEPEPEAEVKAPKKSYRELKQLALTRSKQKWVGGAAVLFLLLAIFLRNLLATVLVVGSALGVLLAAVALVEPLVAARFPGKLTPVRVLTISTGVLLLAVVLWAL
ncbi:MAG TPA: hypothetical protein VJ398_00745 [Acidimicrobiia bacterium]|nr:hypothetical protein [Acidimicrobiia bacterium]